MKIAVIADIHGNAPALEAVLADIERLHVDQIIDLGDAFNGPIDPARVAELLQTQAMIHIRGNGERMVLAVEPSLVLCAHSHVPRFVQVSSTTWVLNPGSVGLPAYALDAPIPHKMEVGSPSARYALVEPVKAGWRVAHIAVPYDWELAATMANRAGFPAWADTLRSGYAA